MNIVYRTILLLCVFVVTPLNAQVIPNPYEYPYANDTICDARDCDDSIEFPCTQADDNNFIVNSSPSFVAWMLNEMQGDIYINNAYAGGLGSSQFWAERLQAEGWMVSSVPVIGAIAWWGPITTVDTFGAMGIVYQINDEDCTVNVHSWNYRCEYVGIYGDLIGVNAQAYLVHPSFDQPPPPTGVQFVFTPGLDGTSIPQFGIAEDRFLIQNHTGQAINANIMVKLEDPQDIQLYAGYHAMDVGETIEVEFSSDMIGDAIIGEYDLVVTYEYGGTEQRIGTPCNREFFVNIIDNTLYDTDKVKLLDPGSRFQEPCELLTTIYPTFRFRGVSIASNYTFKIGEVGIVDENSIQNISDNPPIFTLTSDIELEFNKCYYWYIEAHLEDGNTTHSDTFYFQTPLEYFPDCNITDIDQVTEPDLYEAAQNLCELGIIRPDSYGVDNTLGMLPNAPLIRKDLAEYTTYSLFGGYYHLPATLYTDKYPVPFYDLTRDYDFQRFGKFMTYLAYEGDDMGNTPFEGIYYNFRPFEQVTVFEMLRAIVEAFDIDVDDHTPDGYETAAENADILLPTDNWNLNDIALRYQVILMLHRAMTNAPLSDPVTTFSNGENFLFPSHYTYANFHERPSLMDGNYTYFDNTSFNIPNRGMNIAFTHFYNSEATNIPDEYYACHPFGTKGWNHNWCSYFKFVGGWSENGWNIPNQLLYYAPGSMYPDVWRIVESGSSFLLFPETDGLTYTITPSNDFTKLTIETIGKTIFTYEKQSSNASTWWWTEVRDFNDVYTTLEYEEIDGTNQEHHRLTNVQGSVNPSEWFLELEYSQDEPDCIVRVLGPGLNGNRSIEFGYDDGRLTCFQDLGLDNNPDPNCTSYTYGTGMNRLLIEEIILPKGNIIENDYDSRKLRSSRILDGSIANQEVNIGQEYDELVGSFRSTVTSLANDEYRTDRNSAGYTTYSESKLSDGNMTDTQYDYAGSGNFPGLPSKISQSGTDVTLKYNEIGQPTELRIPSVGIQHEWTYTSDYFLRNFRRKCRGEWQTMSITEYDKGTYGNPLHIRDFEGYEYETKYNNFGQVTETTTPTNIKSYIDYDPGTGLPETIRDHLQNTVRFDYDDIGRTEEVEDPEGNITTLTYYKNDLVKTVTDPEGNITRNSYNANYMLEEFLNSLNEPTDLEYDEDTDLLISQTFGNSTRTYEWLESGLLDVYTDPNGEDFEYRYHDNDQLESDGFLRYHYDSDSERFRPAKIHHEVESSDSLTFDEYDDIDRLLQYTQHYPDVIGGEYSVGYEYDENSNIIKLIYPNDFEVEYFYDKNDRLTKVRDWEGREFRYEWRADGLPRKIILPNGTEKWYDYDEAGRSTSQTWYRMPMQQAFLVYDLERDQRGFVDNETDPPLFADVLPEPQHINYSYTPENRIDTHTDNITGITSTFEYSPNGNCLKSHRYDFDYTRVNQLSELNAHDGSLDAEYYYSPDNKRIAATRNGTTTRYWWDNSGMGYVIGESEPDSEAAKYLYIYGLELLARIDMDTDEIHYYHSDYRGNIVALTDDDQDITHKYRYSTYGTTLNTLEADYNPFRFMGAYGVMHETDDLSYVRARYLDHDNFVFLQEDPIWAENLYTYAGGNPVNFVDETGEFPRLINGIMNTNRFVKLFSKDKNSNTTTNPLEDVKFNVNKNGQVKIEPTKEQFFYIKEDRQQHSMELAQIIQEEAERENYDFKTECLAFQIDVHTIIYKPNNPIYNNLGLTGKGESMEIKHWEVQTDFMCALPNSENFGISQDRHQGIENVIKFEIRSMLPYHMRR